MIVVHALWDASTSPALHLWAESSELFDTRSGPRTVHTTNRSQSVTNKGALPHPFALSSDTLLTQIAEFAGSIAARSMQLATLTLRLPSTTKRPLPSPLLLVERVSEEIGKLRQWTVPTLMLTPGLALDVLLALPQVPPYGIVFDDSLRFWATAANFSLELLTRQAFMPTLQETQHGSKTQYSARWAASLVGTDVERIASLARMIPPLCWSYLPAENTQSTMPREMVQSFLDQTIDAFVRESYTSTTPTNRTRALALPEQWLRALTTNNAILDGSPATLKQFSTSLHFWLDQVAPSRVETPFRTCFRLESPQTPETLLSGDDVQDVQEANATWHITFHLQANDDPSLLVRAEQVWNERSGTLTFLKRNFENPQERLLTDLAKAARVFPLIETSLQTARPQAVQLSTEQAYQFLREATPLLEQSGFGVLVPPWWQKGSARLRARLQLKPKVGAVASSSLLGLDGVVAYNWQIALGDTTLSFQEFERIVKLKRPLIQVRGQWVELKPHEIEAAIAFFKKKRHTGQMSLNEALRLGLGQDTSELGLPVEGVEAEGWIHELLHGLQGGVNIQQIEQPTTLRGKLRPYQLKGVSWLAFLKQFGLGACLADDMGLGKCCSADTLIFANGMPRAAEELWKTYSGETTFDGEGYWTVPTAQLYTNAINEATGQIEQASIQRLYRQHVSEQLRKVRLEDGSSVTITSLHKLLTNRGWTNDFHTGDYVGVSTKLASDDKVGVRYCRIKEIENIEYDGWVYDFEVDQHHNYVANNILCHNTVQLITLLLHERMAKEIQQATAPTLLICPMSIVGNWQRELQRFAPSLSVMVHHGPDRLAGEALLDEVKRHDVVLTTYNIALRDKSYLTEVAWENVVIDEAQNIKNETAKQTQAIKQLHARYKVALTGTPVENRLSELWSIMEFLNPGYLGSGEGFRKGFAIPIERYHDKERSETLRRVIQPFVLRRQKTDKQIIQDLPEKMEMKVFCNLTREQASLYEAVVKEMMEQIEEADGMERRGLILATLTKLKQVCNHPAQFIGDGSSLPRRSGKLIRLEEMLEEVQAEGDKALIFTQYAAMGEMLRRYVQESLGYETLFLHGGTPKKQRDAMVQRFQEERHGPPFFILSIKAGGVGLNLTAANHVFHYDRWWNPAVENQATDRAFRIGQKRNVQVHKFVCVGTLEERIDQMIEQKKELAESIVGSGENWLTEMSTSQLKELFALSRDAIGE